MREPSRSTSPDEWRRIKNIQGAIVTHAYGELEGKRIADIGSSASRVCMAA